MATDDKNNDPEQDDFFGDDDDDFGLPELEYEALDDDSDSESDDSAKEEESSVEEELEDDFASEVEMNDDDSSDDLDIPEDLDDGEEIPDQISDEELEAAMDEEISDEELDEFYEEESFDDFESGGDDSSTEMTDSVFDSDGIDDEEFKKFEKDLGSASESTFKDTSSNSSSYAEEPKGKFTRLVIIGVVSFIALGVAFLFAYNTFSGDEKPVAAKVVKKPVAEKPVAKPVEKKEEPKIEVAPVKAKANQATPGTVNTMTERTGNTHVVIASFLDEDMAADYANELAAAGKSPALIPPFGKAKTTRVTISSYPSLADAQGDLEGFKAEYGPKVWLMRY